MDGDGPRCGVTPEEDRGRDGVELDPEVDDDLCLVDGAATVSATVAMMIATSARDCAVAANRCRGLSESQME